MPDLPVQLTREGPPETVLPPEPADVLDALVAALALHDVTARRDAVAVVVARRPQSLAAWSRLGELGRDPVERYACFRVGYHRGLDQLRQAGWRGSGYVRWRDEPNRGFLRSLDGLRRAAAELGEQSEAARCAEFLAQLDPTGPWRDAE